MKKRRDQGLGSVFRHKGCKRYVIQYYVDGKPVREATGHTSRVEAQKVLTARLNAVAKGEPITIRPVRVSEVYDHLKKHNEANGKTTDTSRWTLHLEADFANVLASHISPSMVLAYRQQRSGQLWRGKRPTAATINRELALLRRMLRQAHRDGLLAAAPYVQMAREAPPREGFVNDAQLDAMRQAAKPLWLRTLVELAGTYGWRKGELIGLTVGQIDFAAGCIRLGVGTTKNRKGREVPLTTAVRELLKASCHGKKTEDRVIGISDPRCSWRNLCTTVGVGKWRCRTQKCGVEQASRGRCPKCGGRRWDYNGITVHDMRRTACRNLRRSGAAENVAMTISGHKTRSVFDRYDIVNNDDKVAALQRLDAMQTRARKAAKRVSGKVVVKRPEIGGANPEIVQ